MRCTILDKDFENLINLPIIPLGREVGPDCFFDYEVGECSARFYHTVIPLLQPVIVAIVVGDNEWIHHIIVRLSQYLTEGLEVNYKKDGGCWEIECRTGESLPTLQMLIEVLGSEAIETHIQKGISSHIERESVQRLLEIYVGNNDFLNNGTDVIAECTKSLSKSQIMRVYSTVITLHTLYYDELQKTT